ncbi:hypothetical protein PENTCL1PPCAC_24173 [Pristionchus entomophagus]|uniref:Uncharacterized protein n=1 Tax=Pristionchus entomophagus TaxID=358040 RepID=A0AAV5U577_9BILA|nr:hypothetical protein PENTCL1PPCAC_24173 [Pristionchus entomophagus]
MTSPSLSQFSREDVHIEDLTGRLTKAVRTIGEALEIDDVTVVQPGGGRECCGDDDEEETERRADYGSSENVIIVEEAAEGVDVGYGRGEGEKSYRSLWKKQR